MASWEATGPCGDLLLGALDRLHRDVGPEVLDDAAGNQEERGEKRDREQNPENRARAVVPEVADALRLLSRDTADHRHRDGDPRGRREEVVEGEPGHLGEVRHRRLAGVALPVGVGREGDRSVPRRVRRDGSEAVRVERQELLQALHRVEDHERGGVDDEHRHRPLDPALVLGGVDSADPVDPALDRPQDRVEQSPLAREHALHVAAQDRRDGDDDRQVDEDLQEIDGRHGFTPFPARTIAQRRYQSRLRLTTSPRTSSHPIRVILLRFDRSDACRRRTPRTRERLRREKRRLPCASPQKVNPISPRKAFPLESPFLNE